MAEPDLVSVSFNAAKFYLFGYLTVCLLRKPFTTSYKCYFLGSAFESLTKISSLQ